MRKRPQLEMVSYGNKKLIPLLVCAVTEELPVGRDPISTYSPPNTFSDITVCYFPHVV